MERETKKFTTKKSKVEFEIKSWLNKAESKGLKRKYNKFIDYSSINQNVNTLKEKVDTAENKEGVVDDLKINFDIDAWDDYQEELVRQYLVSIDGKTDNVFDEYLSLRSEDGDEIDKEIEKYHNKKEKDFLVEGKK